MFSTTAAGAHPFAKVVSSEEVSPPSSGSAESLQLLQRWFNECKENHTECRPAAVSLPDRILELEKTDDGEVTVRLVEGHARHEPYVCLSHRWGPSTPRYRTTKDNLAQHQVIVPWNRMAKTFQEAAVVTLGMGMRHIWIDSLCIVQDDADEWRTQSTRMCGIYSGASLTIAAAWALDSEQGLFSQPPRFPVGASTLGGAPRHVLSEILTHEDQEVTLCCRGWVFQERRLSQRIAYFTESEMRLECIEKRRCTCGFSPGVDGRREHGLALGAGDDDEAGEHWRRAVMEYSQLSLTFATDVLPALAGVAEQYGNTHGDRLGRYVAGMWERTILRDLAWTATSWTYVSGARRRLRGAEYCGPSWSWISLLCDAVIWYCEYYPGDVDRGLSLVDVCVELAGDSPFGGVTHVEMTVTGLVAEGTLQTCADLEFGPGALRSSDDEAYSRSFCPQGMEDGIKFRSDCCLSDPGPEHVPVGSTLYALRVRRDGRPDEYPRSNVEVAAALILRAVEHRGKTKYERVGVMEDRDGVDFERFRGIESMQTITLI